MIEDSGREKLSDKRLVSDVTNMKFVNKLFERLVALDIEFNNVDFRYCIFDAAYIRNCRFQNCDFTGCRFLNCNLMGSSFSGCKFDYATFDKSYIDNDILDNGCPGLENLKLKFARTLRLNYQQIGDSKSANKAIAIELQATGTHLYKAWKSKESYYRHKYKRFDRLKMFGEWCEFKALDLIWGNGESALKLCRAVFIILCIIALHYVFNYENTRLVSSYFKSLFIISPQIFLGTSLPKDYPSLFLTLIVLVRLIMFGFFMSIIIKRFNRR
nr:pentapeptide repeat-containing protein [Providencia rettgeri]